MRLAMGDSESKPGAPFMEGRESREQFGESLAEEKADKLRLGSTLLFQAKKHDRPMPFVAPSWARRFTEDDLRLRPHATSDGYGDLSLEYGYWWVEWGGHLDTVTDNEKFETNCWLLCLACGITLRTVAIMVPKIGLSIGLGLCR